MMIIRCPEKRTGFTLQKTFGWLCDDLRAKNTPSLTNRSRHVPPHDLCLLRGASGLQRSQDEGYRDHLREAVHDLMGLSDAVVEWEQWEQYDSIRDTLRLALTHQLDWSLEDLDLSPSQAEHYMYASDDDSETKPPSASTTPSEDDA